LERADVGRARVLRRRRAAIFGKTIDRPPIQTSTTFKKAPKAPMKVRERQLHLDAADPE
jgi:hypothetical protein